MQEQWLPIQNYEGLYEVSNLGRIKRLARQTPVNSLKKGSYIKTVKETIVKCSLSTQGYVQTSLSRNKIIKQVLVHRLVAQAFIPNPDNKPEVNHKYGVKTDNRTSHLEWCTSQENMKHSFKVLGTVSSMKGRSGALSPTSKPVKCVTTGEEFVSIREAAQKLNFNVWVLSFLLRRPVPFHRRTKLLFRFIEQPQD